MKGLRSVWQKSCSGMQNMPTSVLLAWLLLFKFLVRKAMVEKYISCQHHRKPSDIPFFHAEILVILVIAFLKHSSNSFRDEILHQYPDWQLS